MVLTWTPTFLGSFKPSRSASKSSQEMSRLRRSAFTKASESLMIPSLLMTNTFEPRLATRSAKYWFMPLMRATTRIRVETERMTPSRTRNERSLWARMVCSAMSAGSRKE